MSKHSVPTNADLAQKAAQVADALDGLEDMPTLGTVVLSHRSGHVLIGLADWYEGDSLRQFARWTSTFDAWVTITRKGRLSAQVPFGELTADLELDVPPLIAGALLTRLKVNQSETSARASGATFAGTVAELAVAR